MRATTISPDDFDRVDLRVGTITGAEPHAKARKPAYLLSIDLGPLGTKTSSSQLTDLYEPATLLGRQVVCVCNFAPKRVAGVKSEVLVLGASDGTGCVVLAEFTQAVPNGTQLS